LLSVATEHENNKWFKTYRQAAAKFVNKIITQNGLLILKQRKNSYHYESSIKDDLHVYKKHNPLTLKNS